MLPKLQKNEDHCVPTIIFIRVPTSSKTKHSTHILVKITIFQVKRVAEGCRITLMCTSVALPTWNTTYRHRTAAGMSVNHQTAAGISTQDYSWHQCRHDCSWHKSTPGCNWHVCRHRTATDINIYQTVAGMNVDTKLQFRHDYRWYE